VIVQTFNPGHLAISRAKDHDYLGFYESLDGERSQARYPPFRRLVNVLISSESRSAVARASKAAREALNDALRHAEILGPADCAIERLHGKWRMHILVKLPPDASAAPVGAALEGVPSPGALIVIDVDPYSLL
jgi:primosomal protein N' (replication factor Y)